MALHKESIENVVTALERLAREIEQQRLRSHIERLDSNYRNGLRKCWVLQQALNTSDHQAIRDAHDLLCRFICDCLPWEGEILPLADKLSSAVRALGS